MADKNHWSLPNIVIPSEILFHPTLTNNAKILFGFLRNLTGTDKGCWATNRYLGMLIKASNRTVQDCVASLIEEGFIYSEFITRADKTTERRIHIELGYAEKYRRLVVAGNAMIQEEDNDEDKNHTELLFSAYTHANNCIGGVCENSHEGVRKSAYRSKTIRSKELESKPSLSNANALRQSEGVEKPNNKNLPYKRLCDKLCAIIEGYNQQKITQSKKTKWLNSIRLLHTSDGVSPQQIMKALNWYSEHIGEEYIPEVLCGSSLRKKYSKLVDGMNRENQRSNRTTQHTVYRDTNRNKAKNNYSDVATTKLIT